MNLTGQSRQHVLTRAVAAEASQRAAALGSGIAGQRARVLSASTDGLLRAFVTPCSGSQPVEPASIAAAFSLLADAQAL